MAAHRSPLALGHNARVTELAAELTTEAWTRAGNPARRVGRRVEHHAVIGSTNDRARAALAEPDGDGRAVVADLQTTGRGRRGRAWLSPPGENLMVSVGLKVAIPADRAGWLGIAAALAVHRACAASAPDAGLAVRWPNDVVDARGHKVAGLLIETAVAGSRLTEVVIGVGINVNWRVAEMPRELAGRATSLADLAGVSVDRVELLAKLLDTLDDEIDALEEGRSPVDRLRELFWLAGRPVIVEADAGSVAGTVEGLGDDGALLLATRTGPMAMTVGEVVSVVDAEEAS